VHDREVNVLAISDDGRCLLSIGDDWMAVVWDTATDLPLARFTAEGPLVECRFDADGAAVVFDEAGGRHELRLELARADGARAEPVSSSSPPPAPGT
jgi:hypothetical protein